MEGILLFDSSLSLSVTSSAYVGPTGLHPTYIAISTVLQHIYYLVFVKVVQWFLSKLTSVPYFDLCQSASICQYLRSYKQFVLVLTAINTHQTSVMWNRFDRIRIQINKITKLISNHLLKSQANFHVKPLDPDSESDPDPRTQMNADPHHGI